MKSNWTRIAIALGPAIIIGTIVWEMARTNSSFAFLVNPWSVRGYEIVHGWIFLSIGVGLLLGGLLVMLEAATRLLYSVAIVVYFVVAASAIALIYGDEPITIGASGLFGVVAGLLVAYLVYKVLLETLGEHVALLRRFWSKGLVFLVLVAVSVLLFQALLVGNEATIAVPVLTFASFAVLGALSLASQPRGLAANRMLLAATVVGGTVITLSAGALRETLLRLQVEAEGVSAQYKDIQVGAGWFIALLGVTVLFFGAVGLWAKRRDLMVAQIRARHQREAAEKSAQEIKEAYEQYERERAAAGK